MATPRRRNRIKQPELREYRSRSYRSGKIYGAHLPLRRGYGVTAFDFNPANKSPNGRFINVKGEKIDFYIEEIEANFEMAGTTAQSHTKRQFFPHNMVQPSVTIRGRAPNSYQYNRLSSFVRVAQYQSLNTRQLRASGVPLRNLDNKRGDIIVPTVRLLIRNGSGQSALDGSGFPYRGRSVKGRHQSWVLEGYVKLMPAGARRHDPAPGFEFQFMIAESQQNGTNIGIWSDTAVAGHQIRPWIDIFKSRGKKGFVGGGGKKSTKVKGENVIDDLAGAIDDGIDAIEDIGDAVGDGFDR